MSITVQVFALLAALLHVLFFVMESVLFMKPKVYKSLGAETQEEASAARLFALNQGFYNLFLAVGVFEGIILLHLSGSAVVGQALVLFCCSFMIAASLVLAASAGRPMWRAAIMQGGFPLLVWVGWLLF